MDVTPHAPPVAVDDGGRFRFGCYHTPIYRPDFTRADLSDCFSFWGKGNRRGPGRWYRALRLKQWHSFVVFSDDWVLSAMIAHFGATSRVHCTLTERDGRARHVYERNPAFARGLSFAESSVRGSSTWRDGSEFMVFEYQPQAGGLWSLSFNIRLSSALLLKGQVTVHPDEALALLYPLGTNRAAYTHKEAGNRVEGLLTFGAQEMRLTMRARACMDWTRCFPDRKTRCLALAGGGTTSSGSRLGINLSQGLYDDAENFAWVDGQPSPLGAVELQAPCVAGDPWRVRGNCIEIEVRPDTRWDCTVRGFGTRLTASEEYGVADGTVRVGDVTHTVQGLQTVSVRRDATW